MNGLFHGDIWGFFINPVEKPRFQAFFTCDKAR